MGVVIAIRNATASEWQASNPVLNQGEIGYISDSQALKIGDGTTSFNSLPYVVEGNEVRAETDSKIDESVVYYDQTAGIFKADNTWSTTTLTDGGNF